MTEPFFVVDLDDFCSENSDWPLILKLKEAIPNLRLNLFTIPGLCSWPFIEEMRRIEWIRMYPHGHVHSTSRECQNWSYGVINYHLQSLEGEGWVRLWRSPGWQSSDAVLQCLADRQWLIADQAYNDERRPKELRAYILDRPSRIHGHIGHFGAHNPNSLALIFDQLASLRGEFAFIDEVMVQDEIQAVQQEAR